MVKKYNYFQNLLGLNFAITYGGFIFTVVVHTGILQCKMFLFGICSRYSISEKKNYKTCLKGVQKCVNTSHRNLSAENE